MIKHSNMLFFSFGAMFSQNWGPTVPAGLARFRLFSTKISSSWLKIKYVTSIDTHLPFCTRTLNNYGLAKNWKIVMPTSRQMNHPGLRIQKLAI